MSKNALESVGRKILLIKGNKVVGEGQSILGQGDKYHGISIVEGEVFDQIKNIEPFDHPGLAVKHVYVRFNPVSGEFIEIGFSGEHTQANSVFRAMFAVDKLNFEYGLLPDRFKDVEGFGAKRDAWKSDISLIEIYEGEAVQRDDESILQLIHNRPSEITMKRISNWLEEFRFTEDLTKIKFTYFFKNKTCLLLHYVGDKYETDGIPNMLHVAFATHVVDKPPADRLKPTPFPAEYYRVDYTVQSYPLWQLDRAVGCFVERVNAQSPEKLSSYYA